MSERDEAGLRRLKQDLDEADWPAPELLARYATEPNRLSEPEKQLVERALASNPLVADELATLRGFDFARLDADRRGVSATDPLGAPSTAHGARSLRERLRDALRRPPVFVAVAAVLALLLWLARSDRSADPIAPSTAPPTLAQQPPPARDAITASRDADGPSTPTSKSPSTAPPTSATPAQPDAEPRALAAEDTQRDAAPTTASPNAQGSTTGAPAPSAAPGEPNELRLAMSLPDYHPAYGREAMDAGEWIVRGGEASPVRLTILGPDHVVRACSPQPILHWSLDRSPETGDFRLSIVDEQETPIVDDRALPRPPRAGLQRVDLAALGVVLPVGRTLRWSVSLRPDDASPPTAFDFGWLRVDPPDAAAATELAAAKADDRVARLAALGCYAEAVEAALDARRRQPENASVERALGRLAEQAGLSPELFHE